MGIRKMLLASAIAVCVAVPVSAFADTSAKRRSPSLWKRKSDSPSRPRGPHCTGTPRYSHVLSLPNSGSFFRSIFT